MKTIRTALLGSLFLSLATVPFAQSAATEPADAKNWSSYYYVNVPIERVYPSSYGYLVLYRSGVTLKKAYIPASWLSESAGKGDLIHIRGGKEWPYLTVYYKDGKFDHLKLYVRAELAHPSWGTIPRADDDPAKFDVEDLKLEF